MENTAGIIGMEHEFPEFRYSTEELFDILGNKLSERVKENIRQLGVEKRNFIRPIEYYLQTSAGTTPSSSNHQEPISDLSAKAAKKCLSNLDLKPENISCLIAASENNDYLSPGLSSILIRKIGLSNFTSHFNLQGMACSTFPKVLELGKNLVHNESDNVLIVISGCNSGWYLPHLKDDMFIRNPKEIGENQYDRDLQIKKWVSTMFSFLFGDGVIALVLSKNKNNNSFVKLGKFAHAVNFEQFDYRKACVQLKPQYSNHLYEYELTAGHQVIDMAVDYSKKVLMNFLGKDYNLFDENEANSFMKNFEKVMIHTGSLKILDRFKNLFGLRDNQIQKSYDILREYGNLTGCSIPMIMQKSFIKNNSNNARGLLIGITMGFGLDIVDVERTL